mmetsp:Transcript_29478/g.66060  ORF Transcript_29478/g.66060 Transcript_29478/m.66060 type:complete len:202 (-) Transcript_29478:1540-2145(-)
MVVKTGQFNSPASRSGGSWPPGLPSRGALTHDSPWGFNGKKGATSGHQSQSLSAIPGDTHRQPFCWPRARVVGAGEGTSLGAGVGASVGTAVGGVLGDPVGCGDGGAVGDAVGRLVGGRVGRGVGALDGSPLGAGDGLGVGRGVGIGDGGRVGTGIGGRVGWAVGGWTRANVHSVATLDASGSTATRSSPGTSAAAAFART